MHPGLEETVFDIMKDVSLSNQFDYPFSRRFTFLKKKQLDLKILKAKNQNLDICHAIKRALVFLNKKNLL